MLKNRKQLIALALSTMIFCQSSLLPCLAEDAAAETTEVTLPAASEVLIPAERALSLQDAIDLAIENNPDVGLADVNRDKKGIDSKHAQSASKKIKDTQNKISSAPLPPAMKAKLEAPFSTYTAKEAQYLLPRLAERQDEQAEKVYNIAINGVKVKTESAYYDLLKAQENELISQNSLDRADELLSIANSQLKAGTAAKIDVMKAEATKLGMQAKLTAAQNDTRKNMIALNKVIGLDLNTPLRLEGIFTFTPESFDLLTILKETDEKDMNIIEARDQSEMATWIYDFWFGYYGDNYWDTRQAKQDMYGAKLQLQKTHDEVMALATTYYLDSLSLQEQYNFELKAVEIRQEAYRLKTSSYEVGYATLDEVHEASNDLLKAQAELSECIYNYNLVKSSMEHSIYVDKE
ncbi:MAG: TolC family protein [Bacillota bacterium]|nr:TolC family protein [Bacillota bacterium]